MKTLIIGLDAATWRRMDPLLEEGALPAIEELIDGGVRGSLTSTMPPMTPLAWTSIATGVNPGKHGVFDFLEQDPDSYELSPSDFSRMDRPAAWDLLNAAGTGVGVVNYPAVNPGRESDPFFVSGIPAGIEDDVVYPPEARSSLRELDYRIHPETDPESDPHRYFQEIVAMTEAQRDATLALHDRYDPDVLWSVFMGIDWIQHHLWDRTVDGDDAVDQFYRFIDDIVGDLADAVGDDWSVLVLSDHGARKIDGALHSNSLMEEWGYLSRAEPYPSLSERVRAAALRRGHLLGRRLPRRIKRLVKDLVPGETLHEARKAAGESQLNLAVDIDWRATDAFAFGYMGRLFVHDAERYSDGTLSESESEALVAELTTRLEALEHPETGAPLVERAVPATDVYEGPYETRGPDVLFVPTDWRYMVYGDFGEDWIVEPQDRIADHDREGVVVFSGPAADAGTVDMHVTDVTPTLLYLHDVALLDDMDGSVQTAALADPVLADREPRTVEYDPETATGVEQERTDGDDTVTERLSDLGYL